MDEAKKRVLHRLVDRLEEIIQDGETDPDVRKGNHFLTTGFILHADIVGKMEELLEFIEKNNVTDLKVIKAWLRERSKFAEDGMGVIGPRDSDLYCEGLGHPIVHKGSRDPGK